MQQPAPEDVYETDVDFTALALRYPDFARKLKPNGQLDFSDPESVRLLTQSLAHQHHQLTLTLPADRLCPPIPNRFNYILFVQRLLDSTTPTYHPSPPGSRRLIGLDIGTGPAAIYPLLACRQRPGWLFLATEIDAASRRCAEQNVAQNGLADRVRLLDVEDDALIPLRQLRRLDLEHGLDVLLTNPPFYPSRHAMLASARAKSRPPFSSCTGSAGEMIHPRGGEVGFVSQLIAESAQPALRRHVQWFSAMLGHLSSVGAVIGKLKEARCGNYAATEFVQGQKTRRWCVAWSWRGLRPPARLARGVASLERRAWPVASEVVFAVAVAVAVSSSSRRRRRRRRRRSSSACAAVGQRVHEAVRALQDDDDDEDGEKGGGLQWHWRPAQLTGTGRSARGDCWSRAARRRRQKARRVQQMQMQMQMQKTREGGTAMDAEMQGDDRGAAAADADEDEDEDEDDEPEFAFRITVMDTDTDTDTDMTPSDDDDDGDGDDDDETGDESERSVSVCVRWLQGRDAVLFESFCGWLRRKVRAEGG